MQAKTELSYKDKLTKAFNDLLRKNGSCSAAEVHWEMHERGWLSPADSVLDTADLMRKYFGPPDEQCESCQ